MVIHERWRWAEANNGNHHIYVEGEDQPLFLVNVRGSLRCGGTKERLDLVLQHIVTAHNVYVDNLNKLAKG